MGSADLGIEYPCKRYKPENPYRRGLCLAAHLAASTAWLRRPDAPEESVAAEIVARLAYGGTTGSPIRIAASLLGEPPSDPEIISCLANHVAGRCVGEVCGGPPAGSLDS